MLRTRWAMKSAAAARMAASDYRTFFEKAPFPLLAVSPGTLRITAANDRAVALLGSPLSDLEKQSLHVVLPPADLENVMAFLSGGQISGEIADCKVRDAAGAVQNADLAIT